LATIAAFNRIAIPDRLPDEWREETGVSATTLLEDRHAPDAPLDSTKQTIAKLYRELGQFSG
jgi:hypothetical protein